MQSSWLVVSSFLALSNVTLPASARNLEEILREKGLLSADEAAEAKEAEEGDATAGTAAPTWLSRITPSGDIRVRWEGFLRDGDPDRHRARLRWRLGAKLALSEEMETGFRLTSGNPDDPVSTNQSFTDTFSTKGVAIDNAYLKLTPAASLGLARAVGSVYGGKFDMPVFRPTETVFDADLRPEGFHEVLSLYETKETSFAAQAGQWSAEEVAAGADAWIFGGQLVGRLPVGDGIVLTLAIADYGFQEADLLAAERNGNSTLTVTNDVELSDGSVVGGRRVDPSREGPNGDGLDANGQPIEIVGFAEEFNVLNVGTEVAIDTGRERWPLKLLGDFAQNLEADADDTAFTAGFEVGSAKQPGEVSAGYLYSHKETNSVVSTLTFSDFGPEGGTNVEGHILSASVGLIEALTGVATFYVTEPVDEVAGTNTSTAYRFQIDVLARF